MSSTEVCNSINLKGSVKTITEFFDYAVNNILYQRGIFPSDQFTPVQKYGLTVLMSKDPRVMKYMKSILEQMKQLMLQRKLHRLVMPVIKVDTNETIERWEFKIDCDNSISDDMEVKVDLKQVQDQIRDVIRQITASVTFLPIAEGRTCFDIVFYTDKDTEIPNDWGDSHTYMIPNAEEIELRSFSTKVHTLKASVAYKQAE